MKEMNIKNGLLVALLFLISFSACRNDDGGPDVTSIPIRDRAEQQADDQDTLIDYLESHYYNSGDFVGNLDPTISEIIISELGDGETVPDMHTLLMDAVEIKQTVFLDVDYEYYILRINQGGGTVMPNFSDSIRINFSGELLDEQVFDSSVNPVVFDLTGLIPGWNRVLPEFNISGSFILNGDGTVNYDDSGVGVMFLPSGLGFFADGAPGVPVYANLVFKFELFQTQENDHDGDGIPTQFEDLNDDLNLADDNTDGDTLANFIDFDDDGDGVSTLDEHLHTEYIVDTNMGEEEPVLGSNEYEINRSDEAGVITINTVTIVDSNNDGLDDYLDDSIAINNNPDS